MGAVRVRGPGEGRRWRAGSSRRRRRRPSRSGVDGDGAGAVRVGAADADLDADAALRGQDQGCLDDEFVEGGAAGLVAGAGRRGSTSPVPGSRDDVADGVIGEPGVGAQGQPGR